MRMHRIEGNASFLERGEARNLAKKKILEGLYLIFIGLIAWYTNTIVTMPTNV